MSAHLDALARRIRRADDPLDREGVRTVALTAAAGAGLALLGTLLSGYHAAFLAINGAAATLPGVLLQSITYTGDTLFALALMLLFAQRHPRALWTAVVATLIATLVGRGLKELVHAARPAAALVQGTFHLEGPAYRRNSFPSGHSITAFVVASTLACHFARRWSRLLALALATLVALSRVGVGAHWPVDVAAGAAAGCGSVLAATWVVRHWSAGLRWALSLPGHLVVVGCLAGAAVAELLVAPPYPKAAPFMHTVAALALGLGLWDYVVAPRLDARGAPPGPSTDPAHTTRSDPAD